MKKVNNPDITPFGDQAISLTWQAEIDPGLHVHILVYEQKIREDFKEDILETVVTYNSLVIYLRKGKRANQLIPQLNKIEANSTAHTLTTKNWLIPVCYDPTYAPDLPDMANRLSLTEAEIINLHTGTIYRVYFNGFLPGFPYLGGLSPRLHLPRRSTPRLKVPQGAVGIGGNQTGIYPRESPGGWHLIGQSAVQLFNPDQQPPCPIAPGDTVQFESIDKATFEQQKAIGPILPQLITTP